MARRRRRSGLEDLIDVLALLPWQLCLALIPFVYLGFHWVAGLQPPAPHGMADMGSTIRTQIFKSIAMFLQYIIPFSLLLAACSSWYAKKKRTRLLIEARQRGAGAALHALSWREFELLVAAHFESQGFRITMTPEGADGGVDIVAKKDGETFLVQCKQWRATQVGVGIVRELYGVMAARGAVGAYVVSIGSFSDAAKEFASGRNIEIVDAQRFIRSERKLAASVLQTPIEGMPASTAQCPACGASMILRKAKRGASAGTSFYGCSRYPQCKMTLPTS